MSIFYWVNVRAPNGWLTTLVVHERKESAQELCSPVAVAAGPNGGSLVRSVFTVWSPGPPTSGSQFYVNGEASIELFASQDRHSALVTLNP